MQTAIALPAINEPFAGGFYAGQIRIDGQLYALIVAAKDEGDHDDIAWNSASKSVGGALSYCDGLANTRAMAEAGSALAQWALDLRIGGHADWYIPSQDELEICYRAFKPTTETNWCYARSGINVAAAEPTRPYTPNFPLQTIHEEFREGGEQAFEAVWYWSSTQHASDSACAWSQYFDDGGQSGYHEISEFRARAVRRLIIQ